MGRKEGGRVVRGGREEEWRRMGSPLALVCMHTQWIRERQGEMQHTRVCVCALTRKIPVLRW